MNAGDQTMRKGSLGGQRDERVTHGMRSGDLLSRGSRLVRFGRRPNKDAEIL